MLRISSVDRNCKNYNIILYHGFCSFGKNTRSLPEVKSFLHVLCKQFEDSLVVLLIIFATVSFIASRWSDVPFKWLEAISIYAAVIFAAGIQAICDYGKEMAYFNLRKDEIMSEQV